MTVTIKGFQGTVSDADMATQFPHHAPCVYGPGDLAVTAVAGARRVSIAVGTASGAFVKYMSDAAQTIDLAPPTSGGKWYAISLNRQWSPTNAVTLQADDLAVSNDGTVPATIVAAALAAAQALPNLPGTAGSTSGQRQVLALVHVRAADTTLTVFDLRLQRTGSGVMRAASFHALAYANALLLDGGVLTVTGTTPGGTVTKSQWMRNGGKLEPYGTIEGYSNGAGGWICSDVFNYASAYGAHLNLPALDTYVLDLYSGAAANSGSGYSYAANVNLVQMKYRYNGGGQNSWTRWEGSGSWPSQIDGYASSAETGYWAVSSGIMHAHSFIASNPGEVLSNSGTQVLNLPTPPAEGHGIPWLLGSSLITRSSDFTTWKGSVYQNGSQGFKANLGVDRVDSGGGRVWLTGPGTGFPDGQGGSTRFYWEFDLRYVV